MRMPCDATTGCSSSGEFNGNMPTERGVCMAVRIGFSAWSLLAYMLHTMYCTHRRPAACTPSIIGFLHILLREFIPAMHLDIATEFASVWMEFSFVLQVIVHPPCYCIGGLGRI